MFKSSFFESLLIQSLQLLLIAVTVELDGYDSRVIVTSCFVQFETFKINLLLCFPKI